MAVPLIDLLEAAGCTTTVTGRNVEVQYPYTWDNTTGLVDQWFAENQKRLMDEINKRPAALKLYLEADT